VKDSSETPSGIVYICSPDGLINEPRFTASSERNSELDRKTKRPGPFVRLKLVLKSRRREPFSRVRSVADPAASFPAAAGKNGPILSVEVFTTSFSSVFEEESTIESLPQPKRVAERRKAQKRRVKIEVGMVVGAFRVLS